MTAIEATAGPASLVRVAFSHVLSVSGDPIVDEESMRFKPGEGFMRVTDDVLRPESLRGGARS